MPTGDDEVEDDLVLIYVDLVAGKTFFNIKFIEHNRKIDISRISHS